MKQVQNVNVLDQETIVDFVRSEEIKALELMINILENTIDPEAFRSLNELEQDMFITEQAFRYGMAYGMEMLNQAVKNSLEELLQDSQRA